MTFKNTRKIALVLPLIVSGLFIFSCNSTKPADAPIGDIQVQIPLSDSSNRDVQYKLQTVTLKKIESLRSVKGAYAQFYYAPGLKDNSLDGVSPVAFFIQAANSLFVPKDSLSMQMATLYYHFQNLTLLAKQFGLSDLTSKPVQVAVQARVMQQDGNIMSDNAFFDGHTKAFVFVPYDLNELPISINGGIVAHEFFHSIFYDQVYSVIKKTNIPISQKIRDETLHNAATVTDNLTQQDLFNETYLRGINEGFADFWAWAYTTDPDFLKWSLVEYSKPRSLKQTNDAIYEISQNIENKVTEAVISSDKPADYLGWYIYNVGTGYARFLKTLTELKAQAENISLNDAKKSVSEQLIAFVKTLPIQISALKTEDTLDIKSLFLFFGQKYNNQKISMDQCQHVKKYLSYQNYLDKYDCVMDKDSAKVVKK